MRRAVIALSIIALSGTALGQSRTRPAPAPALRGPPHAWLFGSWTGGLFPVLDGMTEQDCRTQPTVIFGQDAVANATLLGSQMTQRVIETVRTSPDGAEFRFAPAGAAAPGSGFGCDDPNVLHVSRNADGTIAFPRCAGFPYPLTHCPMR